MSLMLPEPLAVQVPPPAPTQVQLQVRLGREGVGDSRPMATLGPRCWR